MGVAFAFGLTVLTMAYTIGHISGAHLNPAVTLGLVTGKRFPARDLLPYWIAQVVGAAVAAGVLYLIASGKEGFDTSGGFASNGYGLHSPGGYSLTACLICEIVMTMFFLLVIMGSTDKRVPNGFAPIAIGLGLTLIHLISIPVTNTSVNPARSTGPALFVGAWALGRPLVVLARTTYRHVLFDGAQNRCSLYSLKMTSRELRRSRHRPGDVEPRRPIRTQQPLSPATRRSQLRLERPSMLSNIA